MTWQQILVKVATWLVRQGADELLKEAQRRQAQEAEARPPRRDGD